MVSERILLPPPPPLYKSMGAIDPWGVASLDPKALTGRVYVGDP